MILFFVVILYQLALNCNAANFDGYYFPPNGSAMHKLHVLPEYPIEYTFDFYSRIKNRVKDEFVNKVLKFFESKTCMKFVKHDPPGPTTHKPVIFKIIGRAEKYRCHAVVRSSNAADLYLNDFCTSINHMVNAVMEAFGLYAVGLKTSKLANFYETLLMNLSQMEPRRFTYHTYSLMPINKIDIWNKMSYCLPAQRLLVDPPDYENDLLSFADIRRLNAMYCWRRVCPPSPEIACQHGSFVNATTCNSCVCPLGFSGRLCENAYQQSPACGEGLIKVENINKIYWAESPLYLATLKPPLLTCAWLYKARPGRQMMFKFTIKQFFMYCTHTYTCIDYVEVRGSADLSVNGYRFCCNGDATKVKIYTESNELLIYMRMQNATHKGTGFRGFIKLIRKNNTSG